MLVDNTIGALLMAIAGHFPGNRNGQIREIRAQTLDFPDGAPLDCAHMAINNRLAYEDWLLRLPSQPGYLVRIQITRSRGEVARRSRRFSACVQGLHHDKHHKLG